MQKNVVTKVLEYYQEKYNVKQKYIYDGICAASTFSKTKVSDREVDFLMIETLLARIGKGAEEFELLLSDEDYDLGVERLAIRTLLWDKNMEAVEERVNCYKCEMPQNQKLHQQIVIYYEMKLAEWRGNSASLICELAREGLSMTKNIEDIPQAQRNLYTPIEIDFLLTLVHFRYKKWKEEDAVQTCLKSMLEYIQIYYAEEGLDEIEGKVWMELMRSFETENCVHKWLEYIDNSIVRLAKQTSIGKLAQVRFMKARLLAGILNEGIDSEELRQHCMIECKMSYCIHRFLKREKQYEEIEKFCREVLQWHITI